MKNTGRHLLVVLMLALGSAALMGCDQGMSGKYGNKVSGMEGMTVEFKSSSKAYVTMPGITDGHSRWPDEEAELELLVG